MKIFAKKPQAPLPHVVFADTRALETSPSGYHTTGNLSIRTRYSKAATHSYSLVHADPVALGA